MAQTQTKKERTRMRMLDAAGQGFRSKGYAGIGVDGIAKAAEATSGAFYAHFGSKDGAFEAALKAGLDEVIAGITTYRTTHGENWVEAFADYYLGQAHRQDLACGCAMTTLSPEIARADPKMHALYEKRMEIIINLIADGLASGDKDQRRARAWAMLGTLIGGLTMARAVHSVKAAETIAAAARQSAITIAGPAKG